MDVPKGYISIVEVPVPAEVTAIITVVKDGVTLDPFEAQSTNKLLEVSLPYAATHNEGRADVSVLFEIQGHSYTKNLVINVVTPYIEMHEVKKILGNSSTDQECFDAEAAARQVINAHTGQEFGLFEGSISVVSNFDDKALPLPRHAVRIDSISAGQTVIMDRNTPTNLFNYLGENQFEITGSGWYIKRPVWGNSLIVGDVYTADPIEYPSYSGIRSFDNDVVYTITGKFGYETVPEPVRQAAKILTEQYECADREYREQYLESIKSADWRIQFTSGAYRRTGNARADKLLSPFVVNRAKVI